MTGAANGANGGTGNGGGGGGGGGFGRIRINAIEACVGNATTASPQPSSDQLSCRY
jgi:hypothetical protein